MTNAQVSDPHGASSAPDDRGLAGIDPDDVTEAYAQRRLEELTDEQLFEAAANLVAQPKAGPADSFQLHAPLELLARRELLRYVEPAHRDAARQRLVWIATRYDTVEPAAAAVAPGRYGAPADAVARLGAALTEGDLDEVDRAAAWLAGHGTLDDVLGLSPVLVPSLAAAAHAPIHLYLSGRVAPRSRAALSLLRPLVHEAARHPDWALRWIDDVPVSGGGRSDGTVEDVVEHVVEGVLATPRLGSPGSDFVYPTMHRVDSDGTAAAVVGPLTPTLADLRPAGVALRRVAAWSMLQDEIDAAPYGWTHTLTLAQAVAGIAARTAEPVRAMRVAATFVVGFRAALSTTTVVPRYEPPRPDVRLEEVGGVLDALDAPPDVAAAAVHHAPSSAVAAVVARLATRAALHEDAHLAKYTLACFDAAADDPDHARLHLSAAAHLGAWWVAHEGHRYGG